MTSLYVKQIKVILYIVLFLFPKIIWTQEINFHIKNEQNLGLENVLIFIDNEYLGSTDSLGYFSAIIKTSKNDSIKFNFELLGYVHLETKIPALKKIHPTFYEYVLISKFEELPEVEFIAQENLFYKYKSWILDFAIIGDQILALVNNYKKTYLSIADADGKIISQLKVHKKASNIIKTCLGTHYLHVDTFYYKIDISDQQIYFSDTIGKYEYNKYLFPCVGIIKQKAIFKSFKDFQKNIEYYTIDPFKKDKKVLYRIKDEKQIIVSKKEFRKLLNSYYASENINENSPNSISYGFPSLELQVDNNPKTINYLDLVNANNTHKAVGIFLNTQLDELPNGFVNFGQTHAFIFDFNLDQAFFLDENLKLGKPIALKLNLKDQKVEIFKLAENEPKSLIQSNKSGDFIIHFHENKVNISKSEHQQKIKRLELIKGVPLLLSTEMKGGVNRPKLEYLR